MTLVQDLDALGFAKEVEHIESKASIWTTAQPIEAPSRASTHAQHSVLATDHAALSDDEVDKTHNEESLGGGKHRVTMVVAGHVDAGKSTIVGNLLYQIGKVSQRTLHKYEKNSAVMGKASFALAWSMDETESERQHGVTIDIAEKTFETNSKVFSFQYCIPIFKILLEFFI